jgi:hypothetical protein
MTTTGSRLLALGLLLGVGFLAQADGPDASFQPEPGYTSLFNGKDLTGWTYKGSKESLEGKTETSDGRISVVNGAIVMNEKDSSGKGGIKDLYTIKPYPKAFHLILEFRAGLKADSGVYVRGPQLQVRDFIRRKEHLHLSKFKNDDWNVLDITVQNGKLLTLVNGKALEPSDKLELVVKDGKPEAKLNDKPIDVKTVAMTIAAQAVCLVNGEPLEVMKNLPNNGGIGLQAETGKFEFRRIRVKELD